MSILCQYYLHVAWEYKQVYWLPKKTLGRIVDTKCFSHGNVSSIRWLYHLKRQERIHLNTRSRRLINWGIPHINICNDKMKNSFFKIQIPQKLRMTRFKMHQVSMLVGSKSNKIFYLSTECLTGNSHKQRERLSHNYTNPRYTCKLQCDATYAIWNCAFRTVWTTVWFYLCSSL